MGATPMRGISTCSAVVEAIWSKFWFDGFGISLYAKRLERGRFPWPSTRDGALSISVAQLGYLLEGIEWRNPIRTRRPSRAG